MAVNIADNRFAEIVLSDGGLHDKKQAITAAAVADNGEMNLAVQHELDDFVEHLKDEAQLLAAQWECRDRLYQTDRLEAARKDLRNAFIVVKTGMDEAKRINAQRRKQGPHRSFS